MLFCARRSGQRWNQLFSSHGMPAVAIAEAAQWVAKREAFMQEFDAIQGKRQDAEQRRELAGEIRNRIADLFQR